VQQHGELEDLSARPREKTADVLTWERVS